MISDDENVRALIEAWRLMSGCFAGSDFQSDGNVASTFANIPLPFLNISFQERPATGPADLRGIFSTMRQRAKACPHPSFIGLCDGWVPEGWEAVAADEGFSFALNMTGMAADELLPLRRPSPELEYRRVQTEATSRDLAMLNAQAYGLPAEMFECICGLELWHADGYGYVGYRDGKAISAAAALPIEGAMYIAFVATLPGEQGKGYAEAVMREAIEQGQTGMGERRIVLHASDMGLPLYRSMGFCVGSKIPLFTPAESPA